MTLEEALYYQLANTSGITDLTSTRIYPVKMPQNVTYPAITFQLVSGVGRIHTMNSDTGNPAAPRFQVSSWGSTLSSTKAVANAVQTALQDVSGVMGGGGGVTVQRIFTESEQIQFYNDEAEIWQLVQDFIIWWEE